MRLIILLSLLFLISCVSTKYNTNTEAANINAKLSMVYLNHGKLELAKSKLLSAFRQDPSNPEVNMALYRYFMVSGNDVLAKKYYLQAIKYGKQDSFEQKLES